MGHYEVARITTTESNWQRFSGGRFGKKNEYCNLLGRIFPEDPPRTRTFSFEDGTMAAELTLSKGKTLADETLAIKAAVGTKITEYDKDGQPLREVTIIGPEGVIFETKRDVTLQKEGSRDIRLTRMER